MRQLILIAALSLISVMPAASQAGWEQISRIEGKNPDGSAYVGAVQVKRVPDTSLYVITWVLDADPDHPILAMGFDHDGQLVVSGSNVAMLASYIANGARSEGLWVVPGVRVPLVETWTRTSFKTLEEARKPAAIPSRRVAPVRGGVQVSR